MDDAGTMTESSRVANRDDIVLVYGILLLGPPRHGGRPARLARDILPQFTNPSHQ